MNTYKSLFGLSSIDANSVDADSMIVNNLTAGTLTLPNGAVNGYVCTSDSSGVISLQPVGEAVLNGDATGTASNNRVDTLAAGTINVNNLVQVNGIICSLASGLASIELMY